MSPVRIALLALLIQLPLGFLIGIRAIAIIGIGPVHSIVVVAISAIALLPLLLTRRGGRTCSLTLLISIAHALVFATGIIVTIALGLLRMLRSGWVLIRHGKISSYGGDGE